LAEEGVSKKDETKKGDHPKEEKKESKKGGEHKEKGEHKEEKKKPARVEPKKDESKKDEDFKYIVRLVNTDVDGNKPLVIGLQSVKGVGPRVAEIIANRANVKRTEKVGNLDDDKVDELEKLILTYGEYVPAWAVNRQLDFETGEDMHIVGVDLDIRRKDDINMMKMIRSYKGVRHEEGQKVRGQRTRSNGRTGLTLGVMRQRLQQPGGAAPSTEKKEEKPAAAPKAAPAAAPAAKPAAPPAAKK
jgi:small subunit ribosomal protein S13